MSKSMAACAVLFAVGSLVVGCKKNVEPAPAEAGPAVVATAAAPATAEVDAAVAPLATATTVVKKPTVKDAGTDAASAAAAVDAAAPAPVASAGPAPGAAVLSKATQSACSNARIMCKAPKDDKAKRLCEGFTNDCKAGGGTI